MMACDMKVSLGGRHTEGIGWSCRATGRHLNTTVSAGRELSLQDGQPDGMLQCPELPGEPILGSHVRRTVLKIQNIRVFM